MPSTFRLLFLIKNMADLVMMYFYIVAIIILNFALQQNTLAQGNTGGTPAIPFTVSSSQSVGSLSSVSPTKTATKNTSSQIDLSDLECPDGVPCSDLGASCINCTMNYSCIYGKDTEAQCTAYSSIKCTVSFKCTYMYKYVQIKLSVSYFTNLFVIEHRF